MHNNYYFLRKLSSELEPILTKSALIECFSQHKDELILKFLKEDQSTFIIRATLEPGFCCLSFPKEYDRARKNSIELFHDLDGARVKGIHQFKNERSFSIQFGDEKELLFKMHGNRANIVHFEKRVAQTLFRNHLKADYSIQLDKFDREIQFDFETFQQKEDNLSAYYVTFGPLPWQWLDDHIMESASIEERWRDFQDLVEKLSSGTFYICSVGGKVTLTKFPIGTVRHESPSAIETINEFYRLYTTENAFEKNQHSYLKRLNADIRHSRNYLSKNKQKLEQLTVDNHYQKWADLIMANMNHISPGMDSVNLEDLYNPGATIHIPLNPRLNPQENAERYYRKGRNQKVEIQKLSEAIEQKAGDLGQMLQLKSAIESASDLKELRGIAKVLGTTQHAEKRVILPYHEFEHMKFKIWVGKNAAANDQLTLKFTHKEDLWLHAKDVAGSHVVIKYQSGKQYPKEVIRRAAELAAFYSKRKTETLCPVSYTSKKYVRKRKGDPPGAVMVDREKVILVEPRQ